MRLRARMLSKNSYLGRWLRLENVFVVVALVFGGLFIFSIAPLHGNDEIVHFPRTYHVSEGNLWTEHLGGHDYGGMVPVQLKQFNDEYREQVQSNNPDVTKLRQLQHRYNAETLTDQTREPLAFTSAGVYSAWSYAPQAVGVFVARVLDLPLNWYVYLGRICTLLVYILLTYFAIKIIPFGKLFLFVIALVPTALSQAATLGMDGLVNGLSWLIIALTLAVYARKVVVSLKLLSLLAFLSVFLATTKQAYMLIALLPLLIPARHYPFTYRKVWLWRIGFAALIGIVSLWYLSATSPINEIMHFVQRPGLYIDEGDQLHHIFQHPLRFLGMIFTQPLPLWSAGTYAGMVGVMTNRTIFVPATVVILLLMTLIITLFQGERVVVAARDKLFVIASSMGALIGTFVLINLALYLSFSQVGHYRVEGLQGRYFLPILPLVGVVLHMLMPRLALKIPDSTIKLIAGLGVLTGLFSALIVLA